MEEFAKESLTLTSFNGDLNERKEIEEVARNVKRDSQRKIGEISSKQVPITLPVRREFNG